MIKTVIFDLGKVIVPFDFTRGYRAMEPLCGYPASEIPKRIASTDLVTRFESGQVEPEDFVAQLCKQLELPLDFKQFCDLWTCIFLPDPLLPDSLFEGLRKRYRVLLLSNTNAIHFGMLQRTHTFFQHFDDLVLSHKVGALKPSPVIYREAIARAQCLPQECFFTDDIPEYVEGAKRAGIDAVQFSNREQLEKELQARGIRWD
jgi:FMN phosphatase YigB (HAD superfamily)